MKLGIGKIMQVVITEHLSREVTMNYPQTHEDNSDNDLHVLDILNEMRHRGLKGSLIYSLMKNSPCYEGLRDLMKLWFEETDSKERSKIIADLQECLDDIQNTSQKPKERPHLT